MGTIPVGRYSGHVGRYARPIRRKKKTSGMAIMVFVIMTVISVSAICYVVYHASVAYHSNNANSGLWTGAEAAKFEHESNERYYDPNRTPLKLRR